MSSLWNWFSKKRQDNNFSIKIHKEMTQDERKKYNELTRGGFKATSSPECPFCGLVVPDEIHTVMGLAGMKPGDMVGTKCSKCGHNYSYPQPSI